MLIVYSTPVLWNIDLKVENHVDYVLHIGKVKLTRVLSSVEKSFRLLKPWSVLGDNGARISTISSKNFLLLKHAVECFDTRHTFQTDASIVMHFEINSKAADRSLLDRKDLLCRVAWSVSRVKIHTNGTIWAWWSSWVEFHAHVDELNNRWRIHICNMLSEVFFLCLHDWITCICCIILFSCHVSMLIASVVLCLDILI